MAQPTTTAHMEAFADSLFAHSCHTLSSCARPPIPLPCDLGCVSRETYTSAERESCPCMSGSGLLLPLSGFSFCCSSVFFDGHFGFTLPVYVASRSFQYKPTSLSLVGS